MLKLSSKKMWKNNQNRRKKSPRINRKKNPRKKYVRKVYHVLFAKPTTDGDESRHVEIKEMQATQEFLRAV